MNVELDDNALGEILSTFAGPMGPKWDFIGIQLHQRYLVQDLRSSPELGKQKVQKIIDEWLGSDDKEVPVCADTMLRVLRSEVVGLGTVAKKIEKEVQMRASSQRAAPQRPVSRPLHSLPPTGAYPSTGASISRFEGTPSLPDGPSPSSPSSFSQGQPSNPSSLALPQQAEEGGLGPHLPSGGGGGRADSGPVQGVFLVNVELDDNALGEILSTFAGPMGPKWDFIGIQLHQRYLVQNLRSSPELGKQKVQKIIDEWLVSNDQEVPVCADTMLRVLRSEVVGLGAVAKKFEKEVQRRASSQRAAPQRPISCPLPNLPSTGAYPSTGASTSRFEGTLSLPDGPSPSNPHSVLQEPLSSNPSSISQGQPSNPSSLALPQQAEEGGLGPHLTSGDCGRADSGPVQGAGSLVQQPIEEQGRTAKGDPLRDPEQGSLPTPATEEGSIIFTQQPKDMSVLEKQSFTVHCKAETGGGGLVYQLCEMKVNGDCSPVTRMTPREDIIVAEGLRGPNPEVTLFVRAFKESDNSVCLDSDCFKVQLKKAMFVAEPLDKVRGIAGRDMMLMCRLATSDEHPPKILYQWYNEERPNSNDFEYLKGQTSNILRLSNLSPNDVGYYGCKVCVEGERPDMYYSKETHLTVGAEEDGEIVITEQPASVGEITVKCGGELKLCVCAMSEVGEPLQFEWHKNGDPLSGGGETLEIKSFTAADIGSYKCVVRATNSGKHVETNEVKVSCPADPARVLPHHKAEAYIKGKLRGKVALLIANQNYNHKDIQKLQTAEQDVHMLADKLRRLGFSVLTLANLTLREMQEAQDIFCNHLLSKDATGVLAFVYFAGHGFVTERDSFEYLMPVDGDLLDPMTNINGTTFCTFLRSAPQFAKLFRITDCCRTVVQSENDVQSPARAPSSLGRLGDYYNCIDVKGCGYSRPAVESFLAKILRGLMADHSLTLQELTSKIREKAIEAGDQSIIQRPQLTTNMNGQEEMKLSDEIDPNAYANYVTDPEPDHECVENWKKLDPSGLPKDHVLSLSNAEWKERAVVKLTIEEVFSNVLRVTVCVERKDAGTNDLTVSIDAEALRKQGKAEVVVGVDTETSARGNEHRVVVRDIQRLKSPLMLWIDVNDGAKRHIDRLCYTPPVNPLYAALMSS